MLLPPLLWKGVPMNSMIPALQDSHNRQFSYLRLSITDVCNFSCNYCLPDGYQCDSKADAQPLNVHEIKNLVTVFAQKGIKKVRITGGEPSIRKDLAEIIATIKGIPGIEIVALTTNGYKLSENIQSWIDAGLDALNVSIDSLDPSVFQVITGHSRLQETLDGLNKALALGLTKVKVNAVLLKNYNLNEFSRFLDWVKHTPISLRFIELMETGDNREYFHQNHVKGQDIQTRLELSGWIQRIRGKNAGPAKEYEHPDYAGSIGLIMPYSKDFCKSCNRLRISSLGKLHLCLFGEGGEDLRPWLQPGINKVLDKDLSRTLSDRVDVALKGKLPEHYLTSHKTGSTRHLSMLGG